ncbi:family 20 glycosylhydrolase, partial [Vibrio sp. FNV 38]|nr:family 20 glycosylhydrolase [Vibrio sp. FNV 38]
MFIVDEPRFGWRGFMLDEGRHFYGKEEVKKIIDVMAAYKMNRFHWHLTEDQGWRIEIKKYPKLTEVGAWRDTKVCAWGDVKPDGIRYGGFYTRKDIEEVVAYAKERFIEIVPEVDIPGHSQA